LGRLPPSGTAQDSPVAFTDQDELSSGAGASSRASIKDRLLADLPGLALWHTPDRVAYGTIDLNGHRENWPLGSNAFRSWLAWHADRALGATLPGQTLEEVVRVYEARALHGDPWSALSGRLRRAAPVLRNCGVVFDNGRRGGRRLIVIRNLNREPG